MPNDYGKILVVDDDEVRLRLYELILRELGFKLIEFASNGKEAVDKVRGDLKKPRVIVMDYRMPLMNGIDATKNILKVEPSIKIIFISADVSVKDKAREIGIDTFLDKPFNIDTFSKLIINTMGE